MAWVGRKYKLDKQEKFDEYMKAIGIGMVMRKMANSSTPVVSMVLNGDEYTFTSEATLKTTVMKFKLGEVIIFL
jgi:fatty acid-binding protein 3